MSLFDGDDNTPEPKPYEDVGREINVPEIARLLCLKGSRAARMKKAYRWLKSVGIARQHVPNGKIFCTLGDLRAHAPHVWLAAALEGDS